MTFILAAKAGEESGLRRGCFQTPLFPASIRKPVRMRLPYIDEGIKNVERQALYVMTDPRIRKRTSAAGEKTIKGLPSYGVNAV